MLRQFAARLPLVLSAAAILFAASEAGPIVFEEIADRSGLKFASDSSPTPNKNQPETMVAGIALLDYDNDGFLDIYFVNGAAIPSLEKESPKYWNRLFHNNHDGTFTEVTAKAGVGGGMLDGKKMWTVGAGWLDYDNDGKLDLFLSNYCKWEVNKDPVCLSGGRLRAYCHPNQYESLPNTLYHNNGDGTFTDVSVETGIAKHKGKGMGVVFNDFDGDGFVDVFVANDNAPNMLFHNLGGKRFEEVALDAGVAYTETGKAVSGMGAEFRDLDNDGLPDIWHTAIELETFPMFRNRGKGVFVDVTSRSGVGRESLQMSGWSNGVADFDNDGWKDLFVARSNVLDNVHEFSARTYPEPNGLFRNLGKMTFQSVGAQAGPDFQALGVHRGAAIGDIDNDGRMDIIVSVLNGPAKYYHNISPKSGNWVAFKLVGSKSNRMGIGAQLKLTSEDGSVQYDIASTSSGYAASSDPRVHFGLGAAKRVRELEIRWPSGIRQVIKDLEASQLHTIEEAR